MTEPTSDIVGPTQPSETESTVPSSEEPSSSETEPTEPSSSETESTEPSTEPSESESTEPTTAKPTPTTKPTQPEKPTVCTHTTVVKGAVVVSYFADGYTGDTVCIKCGVVTAKGETIAKLVLKKPKLKVKVVGNKLKVTYKKVKDATGFQVRYAIKGKWKIKTFKTNKNVTKFIKKLKVGKYKVQVRAMIKQGKQKAFSAWSKTKKVKVK